MASGLFFLLFLFLSSCTVSAVQVDVFTVVYQRFDSLVSGSSFLHELLYSQQEDVFFKTTYTSNLSLSSAACPRGEGHLVPGGGSDGADSGQQPVHGVPQSAGHPQGQGLPAEEVRGHTQLLSF